MPEQPVLDVLGLERLFEQRISLKIDHAEREVFAGSPVSIDLFELGSSQRGPVNR
jgi:hypothetical protein